MAREKASSTLQTRVWVAATWLLCVLAAALAASGGWLSVEHPLDPRTARLAEPRPVNNFSLQRAGGGSFTRTDLLGHYTLIYSGYTRCPDLCPTTLALLSRIYRRQRQALPLRVVFVSIDPGHDRPPLIQRYVDHFAADITGVTGSEANLQSALAEFGFRSAGAATVSQGLPGHSGSVALTGPAGRLLAMFRYPQDPALISAVLADLTDAGAKPLPSPS